MLLFLLALGSPRAAVSQEDPLAAARLIAGKTIRETSFEYNLKPLEYGGGLSGFSLEGFQGESLYPWYANTRIDAQEEGPGYLGFSFAGNITLFLNGEPVFNGSSDTLVVHEYTYDRYRLKEKLPVQWMKGTNELMIRCDPGKKRTSFLMLPQNELDAKPATLVMMPPSGDLSGVDWILSGPFKSLDQRSMPEKGFREFYAQEPGFIPWKVPGRPLVRELVIPDSASYTRDPYADWHYASGGTMLGILNLFQVTGDSTYLDFVRQYAGNIEENREYFRWQYETLHAMRGSFHRLFRMTMLDDSGGPALPFAELQASDPGSAGHMALLSRVFDYVMEGQERLPDGTFCRPEPEASTVWADDLFMSVPFLLRMAEITGDSSLYDEAARQVIQFNRYLSDPATGLWFHGWFDQRQENTPVRWGRANGWIVWATSEALMHMPQDHPDYGLILQIFRTHMEALAACQDPSGMWHQVLDHPETYPETSCTAMFTLGMARGVRMGWLDESYRDHALRGWEALRGKIGPDGTVKDICRGTGIGEDVAFYETRARFDHDPRGLGAMLTAGCEIHLLAEQKE